MRDNPVLQDTKVFARAEAAFDHVGLRLNDDKKRRNLVYLGPKLTVF